MPRIIPTLRTLVTSAGLLLALATCSEGPTTPAEAPPRFHLVPVALPEAELLVLCKAGPVGTYSFDATATHPVLYNPNTNTYGLTQQTYTITVDPGSTINVGGVSVPGDCYGFTNANGDHNHVAVASGSLDASVTIVEAGIPDGISFVKADIYQLSGGTVTLSTVTTNSATGSLGGNASGLTGANVVFYNEVTPAPAIDIEKATNGDDADAPTGPKVPVGSTVTWTYVVTNTGNVPLTDVAVSDDVLGTTGIDCGAGTNLIGDLAVGAVATCTATGIAVAGQYANLGTVTGKYGSQTVTDTDPSHYYGELTETPCPGGSFTYSFNAAGDLLIKYDQFPAPNDNSYGVNAVGWITHDHKFSDLTGSDKAGFQLADGSGVIRLSFNVDYLSADASKPSGYGSLGVNGGDGKMVVGTATGITATTSLANNLNNINIPGLFVNKVQQFGSVNVLVDSPPTDAAHQTYNISDPLLAGWDFHNTYYVTISAAKLASIGFDPATWKVEPNLTVLHNSPAKPCPPPAGGECNLSTTKYEVKDKQVKITILNGGTVDQFLTRLSVNWPVANGMLMQVKLAGDVIYDKPDIAGGSAVLTTAELVSDTNKRKIAKGNSKVLTLIFEKNADPNLANYLASVDFGNCTLALLPN